MKIAELMSKTTVLNDSLKYIYEPPSNQKTSLRELHNVKEESAEVDQAFKPETTIIVKEENDLSRQNVSTTKPCSKSNESTSVRAFQNESSIIVKQENDISLQNDSTSKSFSKSNIKSNELISEKKVNYEVNGVKEEPTDAVRFFKHECLIKHENDIFKPIKQLNHSANLTKKVGE